MNIIIYIGKWDWGVLLRERGVARGCGVSGCGCGCVVRAEWMRLGVEKEGEGLGKRWMDGCRLGWVGFTGLVGWVGLGGGKVLALWFFGRLGWVGLGLGGGKVLTLWFFGLGCCCGGGGVGGSWTLYYTSLVIGVGKPEWYTEIAN